MSSPIPWFSFNEISKTYIYFFVTTHMRCITPLHLTRSPCLKSSNSVKETKAEKRLEGPSKPSLFSEPFKYYLCNLVEWKVHISLNRIMAV